MSPSSTSLAVLTAAVLLVGCSGGDTDGEVDAPDDAAADAPALQPQAGPQVVDADTAVALLDDRDDLTIIDVRTPAEHTEGHLAGTLLLDIQGPTFTDDLDALDRDGAYLVYCRTGNRSATAVERMAAMGFTEVYDAGGFDDLAAAGADTAT